MFSDRAEDGKHSLHSPDARGAERTQSRGAGLDLRRKQSKYAKRAAAEPRLTTRRSSARRSCGMALPFSTQLWWTTNDGGSSGAGRFRHIPSLQNRERGDTSDIFHWPNHTPEQRAKVEAA